MAENSKIEWTHHTFNPWRGCTRVAPECRFCYADAMSKRNPSTLGAWGDNGTRVVAAESYWKEPLKWNRQAQAAGERHRVFCASLADVFEDWDGPMVATNGKILEECPSCGEWYHRESISTSCCKSLPIPLIMDGVRRRLFALIDATPHLDWLLLTKRPENILRMWPRAGSSHPPEPEPQRRFLGNVWLGTSAGTQATADRNIPELLKCRNLSPVLFLSVEPMLGPIDLTTIQTDVVEINCLTGTHGVASPHRGFEDRHVNWVIAGGESGPHARPMHPDWARSLRDQCAAAGVPFHFKQWGEWWPQSQGCGDDSDDDCRYGEFHGAGDFVESCMCEEGTESIVRIGKKLAGRLLDGVEHNEFPQPVCQAGQ